MNNANIKYQLIKINIAQSGEKIKFSADTDKKYARVTGLFASLPDAAALLGATLELRIADFEIFPEDFELKLLTCGQEVSPNERFYNRVDHEAGGSRIEGRYTDGGHAQSYPFTAILYLRLENPADGSH